MWIRKSPAEIDRTKRIKRLKRFDPTLPFLVTFALCCLEFIFTYGTAGALSFTSPVFLPFFLLVFGLLYLSRVFFGDFFSFFAIRSRYPPNPKLDKICGHCLKIQAGNGAHSCGCGGQLEPLDYWRWVENLKTEVSDHTSE